MCELFSEEDLNESIRSTMPPKEGELVSLSSFRRYQFALVLIRNLVENRQGISASIINCLTIFAS